MGLQVVEVGGPKAEGNRKSEALYLARVRGSLRTGQYAGAQNLL
jgi:hypothetical protein